jgi:hypothetical protein
VRGTINRRLTTHNVHVLHCQPGARRWRLSWRLWSAARAGSDHQKPCRAGRAPHDADLFGGARVRCAHVRAVCALAGTSVVRLAKFKSGRAFELPGWRCTARVRVQGKRVLRAGEGRAVHVRV